MIPLQSLELIKAATASIQLFSTTSRSNKFKIWRYALWKPCFFLQGGMFVQMLKDNLSVSLYNLVFSKAPLLRVGRSSGSSLGFSEANVNHHIKGKESHHLFPAGCRPQAAPSWTTAGVFLTAFCCSPSDFFLLHLIKPECRESISYGSILTLASVSASDLDGFSLILSLAH